MAGRIEIAMKRMMKMTMAKMVNTMKAQDQAMAPDLVATPLTALQNLQNQNQNQMVPSHAEIQADIKIGIRMKRMEKRIRFDSI